MTSPIRKPEGRWLGLAGWQCWHWCDSFGTCWASDLLLLLAGGIPMENRVPGPARLIFFLYTGRQVGEEGMEQE